MPDHEVKIGPMNFEMLGWFKYVAQLSHYRIFKIISTQNNITNIILTHANKIKT